MILDFFRLLKSVDTHVEKENSPNLLEKSSHSFFFLQCVFCVNTINVQIVTFFVTI